MKRLQISIQGAVQGVGFRPFVYRLATSLDLKGFVSNTSQGVVIEVEGPENSVENFLFRLPREKPSHALLEKMESTSLPPQNSSHFEILKSQEQEEKKAWILPDLSTCPECLKELLDPGNRRYLYPFTNCTYCGPRFTIITDLPYDRCHTTMDPFLFCPPCREEYENPLDRRFHAQPNACPICGPHLELWDSGGHILALRHEALVAAGKALREGKILALKGLGGFHLMVDGRNEEAVRNLRSRKERPGKPLAVMFPGLSQIQEICHVSKEEEAILLSAQAPIVLLKKKKNLSSLAHSIDFKLHYVGAFLPYTPLHHLLLRELSFPLVATSGNLSEEPICTDEKEALQKLGKIADVFLVHNRPIARPVDDSVVQAIDGTIQILRRARGYAPLPLVCPQEIPPSLALGGHLKNTVAFSRGKEIFLSQHIGDLENTSSYEHFLRTVRDFEKMYSFAPGKAIADLHPGYLSHQYASSLSLPTFFIQHHYSHGVACMWEHKLRESALAVVWDGSGDGGDGTIWGGEFLILLEKGGWTRKAFFSPFPLPGGEKAVREPRRSALGMMHKMGLLEDHPFSFHPLLQKWWEKNFSPGEQKIFPQMLKKNFNSPLTSSVGRLFDGLASLLDFCHISTFEGEGALGLQGSAEESNTSRFYSLSLPSHPPEPAEIQWQSMITEIFKDLEEGISVGEISRAFHNSLVEIVVEVAKQAGFPSVLLTGGCFQNSYLLEKSIQRLREEGFHPYWPQHFPPNDGGLALGQICASFYLNHKGE